MTMPAPLSMQNGWEADLRLRYARDGARTVLAERLHRGPLVVQKALYPEDASVCHSIIVHPPGGIAGGDRIAIDARVEAGAHALITTPGATRWYRCDRHEQQPASQSVTLAAAAGAIIEWLPQETIYFDRTRARNQLAVDLARDATFIGWEVACLGRTRAGEGFDHGEVRQVMKLSVGARLRWCEQGRMRAGDAVLASPLGMNGERVLATFVARSPHCDDNSGALGASLAEACRDVPLPGGVRAGVSLIDGILVGRALGGSAETVRTLLVEWWKIVRMPLCGQPAANPRIWRT